MKYIQESSGNDKRAVIFMDEDNSYHIAYYYPLTRYLRTVEQKDLETAVAVAESWTRSQLLTE